MYELPSKMFGYRERKKHRVDKSKKKIKFVVSVIKSIKLNPTSFRMVLSPLHVLDWQS